MYTHIYTYIYTHFGSARADAIENRQITIRKSNLRQSICIYIYIYKIYICDQIMYTNTRICLRQIGKFRVAIRESKLLHVCLQK